MIKKYITMLAVMSVASCGHKIELTKEQATLCKDGMCLTVTKDGQFTFSQMQPMTDQPPVVIQQKK